jgi:hypothetical protein
MVYAMDNGSGADCIAAVQEALLPRFFATRRGRWDESVAKTDGCMVKMLLLSIYITLQWIEIEQSVLVCRKTRL